MAKTITWTALLAGLALAGCQHPGAPKSPPPPHAPAHAQVAPEKAPPPAHGAHAPEVPPMALGSDAWFAWVDRTAGVSDGHGHGPDFGSSEWCHAANWRVFRVHNTEGDDCSLAWMRKLDAALRQAGH